MAYGYGLHIDDAADCRSSEHAWAGEKHRVHNTTSFELRKELWEIYEKSDHPSLCRNKLDFVNDMSWRVYTEWCMDPKTKGEDCKSYDESVLTDFIDDEIKYASKRLKKLGLDGSGIVPQSDDLPEIRERILTGLVKRGIELFGEWGGGMPFRDKKDKRNLRCNLREYVSF